jgi:N6-L-threonylcarbamoyladenine synthase
MKILGIETSCDETAIAIIESDQEKNISVLANIVHSQIEIHKEFGGVFPSLAKREHAINLVPVLIQALEMAKLFTKKEKSENILSESLLQELFKKESELVKTFSQLFSIQKPDIDLITVTEGPGLEPALWVGINFAKALGQLWNIPVLPINHMEGHIVSVINQNQKIETPAIALLISGGHTELVLVKEIGEYEIIGQTKDDAVGEAFDKVARLLGLEYPGGPKISKLAQEFRDLNLDKKIIDSKTDEEIEIKLPRPMLHSNDLNFSFSGLKTAVLYLVRKLEEKNLLNENVKKIIACEFEDAVTEVILKKTEKALQQYDVKNLIVGGGVIANKNIREKIIHLTDNVLLPENSSITDNGLMIAIAGLYKNERFEKNETKIAPADITAKGNLKLG